MTLTAEKIMSNTFTICNLSTPEGKKFLRRVIRQNDSLGYREAWDVTASPSTDWRLEFARCVKGEIGDEERIVTIRTDLHVRCDYKPGDKESFSDCKPVYLCGCRYLRLDSGHTQTLCHLLLNKKPSVWVKGHAGSASSSQFGISFYDVHVSWEELKHRDVVIGYQTVAVNGRRVCSGSVELEQ
jgi:hypothetical protein